MVVRRLRFGDSGGRTMNRLVKWAILFTPFEEEGTEYVKEGCGSVWTQDSPVKVFDTYEEAQKECAKWNTGEIVRWLSLIHI